MFGCARCFLPASFALLALALFACGGQASAQDGPYALAEPGFRSADNPWAASLDLSPMVGAEDEASPGVHFKKPFVFVLSDTVKKILGLSLNTDDTDGDGVPDVVEIAMNSDPLDPCTEQLGYTDYEAYFRYGLFPPLRTRKGPDDIPPPRMPQIYPNDPTPSSFCRPAVVRKKGAPIQLKYERLVREGKIAEAEEVKKRATYMCILKLYGEDALIRCANGLPPRTTTEEHGGLMRFHEEWPDYYGEEDTDFDGIPDLMEEMGHLFGGLNYDEYGSFYWDRLYFLAVTFPAGYDGVIIGNYIYEDSSTGFRYIRTDPNMWDTDNDGLDDYFEYLWHSCPLLRHSDWSSGSKDDHAKIYEDFTAPRPDWVLPNHDWDDDGIPNGAEYYFMMEVLGAQLDPECASSDWDQYDDREEWMSWWYKGGDHPYPLDDPLPYVVRNGCHPLIPAYPVVVLEHQKDVLRLPFNSVFTAARGISGSSSLTAEVSSEAEIKFEFKFGFIPVPKFGGKSGMTGRAASTVTNAWDMTSTTAYDYSQAQVINCFTIKNVGTEPLDFNPGGAELFSMAIDIYWPNDFQRIYACNQHIGGVDGLIPYTGGETDLPDSINFAITHTLRDLVGIETEIGNTDHPIPSLSTFNGFCWGTGIANTIISFILPAAPGVGYAAAKVALSAELIAGAAIVASYENDLYRDFIDDFVRADRMTYVISQPPSYNTGADGRFSCDNLCDWTSILAAHRNYVTIMCVYPGESDLPNILKESPIKPEEEREDPADSFYTLAELVAKYAGTKIEPFYFDSVGDMDTLVGVGCYPNVGYGDTVIPPFCDDTLTSFGKWVIVSSIDTIAEPERLDDLEESPSGEKYIGGGLVLKKGDIFILYYLRDQDSDSLEDQLEYVFGTNPYNRDTDGDGLGDKFELENALDPLNKNSDNSFYNALDGEEWNFLTESEGLRVPVGLPNGDTIQPPRSAWNEYLMGSPRVDSLGNRDFVPFVYNLGGYDSKEDDQYMDYNINGVPDWLEKYFHDPAESWDGRFVITWDGEQTIEFPWGYTDNIFEYHGVDYAPSCTTHMCKRILDPDDPDNGVLEIIFTDKTETNEIWDNSYIYFKLFNCDIDVGKSMELSYEIKPLTAKGKLICIDLLFADGFRSIVVDTFYDSDGFRMHPAWRPQEGYALDEWHLVTVPLDIFAGKTIKAILVGYEDDPNEIHGLVHAYIDNLTIRSKNIVFTFEPETAPAEGFLVDALVENRGMLGWNGEGEPTCRLRSLPTPEDTIPSGVADTMLFGPRDTVYEVSAYIYPFDIQYDEPHEFGFTFELLPRSLAYRIDENTTFGYYIWQDYAPRLYAERGDLPELIPPGVVVDLRIVSPDLADTTTLFDYARSHDLDLRDQFGSPLHPLDRNHFDSDSNLTWRPPSGSFWRYIDYQLPDELSGWFVDNILVRYETDLPFVGNIRAYIDNVALFERAVDVYVNHRDSYFGAPLIDAYDDNNDTIVDWEELNVHRIPEAKLYDSFTKHTYAGLLLKNYIGGIPPDSIDTTSWYWHFALNHDDSTFKYSHTWRRSEDWFTTLIDVDTLMLSTWDDGGGRFDAIFGYTSNVPGDIEHIYEPSLLCWRVRYPGRGGVLKVMSPALASPESTKLFDVNPTPLCTNQCLVMMFDGWRASGEVYLGYKLQSAGGIVWFPACTSAVATTYRCPVPDSLAGSGDTVVSVWIKVEGDEETEAYIDNFSLKRAFYNSFEVGEEEYLRENDLISSENIDCSDDTCMVVDEGYSLMMPPIPNGERCMMVGVDLNGFSPATFRYRIFQFFDDAPAGTEIQLTQYSYLEYKIFHHSEPTFDARGYAIVDVELYDTLTGETTWLSDYNPLAADGRSFTPQMRGDPSECWVTVHVDVPPEAVGKLLKSIAIYYKKPAVVEPAHVNIFVDEVIFTF